MKSRSNGFLSLLLLPFAGVSLCSGEIIPLTLDGETSIDFWSPENLTAVANPGFPNAFNYTQPWPSSISSAGPGDSSLSKIANGLEGAPIPSGQSLYFLGFAGGDNAFGGTLSLEDITPVADLATLALQIEIGGASGYDLWNNDTTQSPDLSGVKLHYTTTTGHSGVLEADTAQLLDTFFSSTTDMPTGPNGEDRPEDVYNRLYGLQWDLSTVGPISEYRIEFSAVEHSQLYHLRTDQTSHPYGTTSVFPADEIWTGGDLSTHWDAPANWQASRVPENERNIVFLDGSAATLTGDISQKSLNLSTSGPFLLSSQNGEVLTLSSGIKATSTVATHEISSPLLLESYNLFDLSENNTLILSGAISGSGFYKQGPGTLILAGDNLYDGADALFRTNGLIIRDGDNTITGTNRISGGNFGTFNIRPDTTVRLSGGDERLDSQFTANLLGATSRLILGDSNGATRQTFAGLGGIVANVPVTGSSVTGGSVEFSTLALNTSGSSTFAGNIGGSTGLENHLHLVKTGSGTQFLTGSTTYLGTTEIQGGALAMEPEGHRVILNGGVLAIKGDYTTTLGDGIRFDGPGGLAAHRQGESDPAPAGISFNSGALLSWGTSGFLGQGQTLHLSAPYTNTTIRFDNPLNIGSAERLVNVADGLHATDAILAGALSGSGTLSKTGTGTLFLTGANTLTGALRVHSGYLTVTGPGGSLSGGVVVEGGAFMRVTNTAADNLSNRLSSTSPFTLRGGFLTYTAAPAGTMDSTGELRLENGANTVLTVRGNASTTTSLTFSSISRATGSTLNLSGTGVGQSEGRNQVHLTTPPTLTNNIIGGWLHVANEFATVTPQGIAPLAAYQTGGEGSWLPTDNVRVANTQPATLSASREVHSLRLVGGTGGNLLDLAGHRLHIGSGGILASGGTDVNITKIHNGIITAGASEALSAEMVLLVNGPLEVSATIADPTPEIPLTLTKSGSYAVTLQTATSHTGFTYLNQGNFRLGTTGSLSSSPRIQLNTGATLDVTAASPAYTIPTHQTLTGVGTVTGSTAVEGILSPLPASSGKMTVNGALALESTSRLAVPFHTLGGEIISGSITVNGTTRIEEGATLVLQTEDVDFTAAAWRTPRVFPILATTNFAEDYSGAIPITVSAQSAGAGGGSWSISVDSKVIYLHWEPGDAMAAWRYVYFGTADNTGAAADHEDPDHDGIPNLLEYALGTHPRSATGTNGHTALPSVFLSGGDYGLSFSHPEPPPHGVRYEVQATTDFTDWKVIASLPAAGTWTWHGTGPSGISTTNVEGQTLITVNDETISPPPPHRFFRLKAIYSDAP